MDKDYLPSYHLVRMRLVSIASKYSYDIIRYCFADGRVMADVRLALARPFVLNRDFLDRDFLDRACAYLCDCACAIKHVFVSCLVCVVCLFSLTEIRILQKIHSVKHNMNARAHV